MTAKVFEHEGKFGVECELGGLIYDPLFPKATAERVAELVNEGRGDWDDVEPVLEHEGRQILA